VHKRTTIAYNKRCGNSLPPRPACAQPTHDRAAAEAPALQQHRQEMRPMPNPTLRASDFHPEVLRLFDQYVHGGIDRRGFLDGASKFAVGGVTSVMLLEALSPKFARAQKVPPTDARIRTDYLTYDSPDGTGKVRGYLARPAQASGPLPVVIVAHENRGLNPHIEDIARRLALDNFIAFAPDALTILGGYPGDEDKARDLFAKLDQPSAQEDFVAGAQFARKLPGSNGKLGAVGFCYGGGIANLLATRLPDLNASVPFYGPAPSAQNAAKIKSPLLVVYAETDERINAGWPAYEAALKAAGVIYDMKRYPGTQHGFNNDTTPRFDDAAARDAWARTVDLFNKTLRG
jgi:carboxymethylenebutenolidase